MSERTTLLLKQRITRSGGVFYAVPACVIQNEYRDTIHVVLEGHRSESVTLAVIRALNRRLSMGFNHLPDAISKIERLQAYTRRPDPQEAMDGLNWLIEWADIAPSKYWSPVTVASIEYN